LNDDFHSDAFLSQTGGEIEDVVIGGEIPYSGAAMQSVEIPHAPSMKILVSGGAGFMGSQMLRYFRGVQPAA